MKKFALVLLPVILIIALVLTGCSQGTTPGQTVSTTTVTVTSPPTTVTAPAPSGKVYNWQFQTWNSPTSINMNLIKQDVELLKTMSGGRLVLTPLAGGTLVGYSEMLEACGKGLFEIGFNACTTFSGLDAAFSVIWNLPAVWQDPREVKIWYETAGGKQIHEELYAPYNVHFLAPAGRASEPLMSKSPMTSIADFKGKKIRTQVGINWDLFTKIGAIPVDLPPEEIYSGLDSGLIDMCENASMTTNYDAGLYEVTKYILNPGFQSPTGNNDVSINMDAWKGLPADLQACLVAWGKVFGEHQDLFITGEDVKALGKMVDKGMIVNNLSPEELNIIRVWSLEFFQSSKEKSPMARKVLESVEAFMKQQGKM